MNIYIKYIQCVLMYDFITIEIGFITIFLNEIFTSQISYKFPNFYIQSQLRR